MVLNRTGYQTLTRHAAQSVSDARIKNSGERKKNIVLIQKCAGIHII